MQSLAWLLAAFGLALLFASLTMPLVIRVAALFEWLDSPADARRLHDSPVPRLGGVAVYLAGAGVAVSILVMLDPAAALAGPQGGKELRFLTGVLLGSALLFVTGLVDDVRGLSPIVKLAAQVVATLIAFYFGADLKAVSLGYSEGVATGLFSLPLLLLWTVGVTNVFNFIDGLNGLAGGVAVVASAAIFIAALALGNVLILVPAAALAGALTGFLRFNFPAARIFLGDSGSLSVGFILAMLSVRASVNAYGAVLVVIPLLALFVPIVDGSLAILRRWLRHVPLSGADARHIHHRIIALGVSPRKTAVLLWILAAGMAGFGLLMALTVPYVATSVAVLGLAGIPILIIYGTNVLAYDEIIVAREVLLTGPARMRRVISSQILARDVVAVIGKTRDIGQLNALLSESAARFGFLAIELTGPDASIRHLPGDSDGRQRWEWKLDYPIRLEPERTAQEYVLSIWCASQRSARPQSAERIARVLGPAIQAWFKDRAMGDAREAAAGAATSAGQARNSELPRLDEKRDSGRWTRSVF